MTEVAECPLTEKELEILRDISNGKRPKEISRDRGDSSQSTVLGLLRTARLRGRVQTTEGLIAKAIRKGWIE